MKDQAPYSVREAMRRAEVPNWQMGGGVSSADAVDYIAAKRDEAIAERDEARRVAYWATALSFGLGLVLGIAVTMTVVSG